MVLGDDCPTSAIVGAFGKKDGDRRKGFQIWNTTPLASLEPGIKSLKIPFFHEFHKTASEIVQDFNEWVLSNEGEGALFLALLRVWVS